VTVLDKTIASPAEYQGQHRVAGMAFYGQILDIAVIAGHKYQRCTQIDAGQHSVEEFFELDQLGVRTRQVLRVTGPVSLEILEQAKPVLLRLNTDDLSGLTGSIQWNLYLFFYQRFIG